MNDATDPSAWTALAEEDLLLARSALHRKRPLTYGACFHAQQCVEKYLKALLVQRGLPFPKTHDLSALAELIGPISSSLGLNVDLLDVLSSYAVRVRYPGEVPSTEEAREAVQIAVMVRRAARNALLST